MSTHWKISSIVSEHVKLLDEHAKRVGAIVDQATSRFNADYTGFVAGFCAFIIAGSIAIALAGIPSTVSVTGMIVGGVGLIAAMTYRYINRCQHAEALLKLAEIERERLNSLRRAATMTAVQTYGLPDGTPLGQLQLLLGDEPTAFGPDGSERAWKALPAPEDKDGMPESAAHVEQQEDEPVK